MFWDQSPLSLVDSNMLAGVKQMFSSGEKPEELVDPYVIVEFAGAKQVLHKWVA